MTTDPDRRDTPTAPDAVVTPSRPVCGRPKRQGSGPCTRPAGWGTDHLGVGACKLHGGNTNSGRVRAARDLVQREAAAALARLGEPDPVTNPVYRLQVLAGKAEQAMSIFEALVRELTADDIVTLDNFGAEHVRAVLAGFGDAMDRCHRMHADLVRLNLEERAQRLDEAQSRLVWTAVDRGLREALPPELYDEARRAVGRAARALVVEIEPALPAGTEEA